MLLYLLKQFFLLPAAHICMHTHVVTDILYFLHFHQQVINTNYRRERAPAGIIELPQAVQKRLTEQYCSLTGAAVGPKFYDIDGSQKQLCQLESLGLTCYSHISVSSAEYILNS